jgi:hypothetical protein
MTPEQSARRKNEARLVACGWIARNFQMGAGTNPGNPVGAGPNAVEHEYFKTKNRTDLLPYSLADERTVNSL